MNRWLYAAWMLAAILVCAYLLKRQQQRLAISTSDKWLLGLAAWCGAMLGAKLPMALVQPTGFWHLATWLADGKTIMFGITGAYISVVMMKWALGIHIRTGDSYAVPVATGVSLGRIACFVGGCCFGKVTDLPWGVHFPTVDTDPSVCRHPTQIYEAIFHAIAALTLWQVQRYLSRSEQAAIVSGTLQPPLISRFLRGNLLKAYFIAYMLFRFFTEYLRPEPLLGFGLTVYQVASCVLAIGFASAWLYDVRRHRNPTQPQSAP